MPLSPGISSQSAIKCLMPAFNLSSQSPEILTLRNHVLSLSCSTLCGSYCCLLCCINLLTRSPTSYSFGSEVSLCQLLATSGQRCRSRRTWQRWISCRVSAISEQCLLGTHSLSRNVSLQFISSLQRAWNDHLCPCYYLENAADSDISGNGQRSGRG